MAETKKPIKIIRDGDMAPEVRALPDEDKNRPPPKGIGTSENDRAPTEKENARDRALREKYELEKNKIINKPNKEVKKFDENYKKGGKVKKMAKGGSTASKRADGCATKGKTKGRMV